MDANVDKGEGPSSSRSTLQGPPVSTTIPTSTHPLVADDEPYGLYVAAAQQLEPPSQQLEPAPPLLLSSIDDNGPTDEIEIDQSCVPSATSSLNATSGFSAIQSSGLAIATTLTRLPYAAATQPRRPSQSHLPNAPAPQLAAGGNAQEEALRVRSNILRGMWQSLSRLWKPRLVFFLLRLALSLLQIVACLVILALPSSLGNSPSGGDIDGDPPAPGSQCDPEPIFIYLVLYVTRLVVLLPLDIYLTLSPHGNARQRRPGARNFAERERNRTFGSLERDRKVAQFVDLLSLGYCVLFVVGNWAVWSRTECSHRPADSLPLFYTALSMLCLTYLYILVILIITILVVFFLPLFLVILRALGITRRLPQPDIKPETGKVQKDEVEKVTKLVYYVDEDEWLRVVRNSRQERSSLEQLMPFSAWTSELTFVARINTQVASRVALPASPPLPPAKEEDPVFLIHALPGTTISNSAGTDVTSNSTTPDARATGPSSRARAGAARPHRSRARLGQMLPFGRRGARTRSTAATAAADKMASSPNSTSSASSQAARTKAADAPPDSTRTAPATAMAAPAVAAVVADADRRLRYPLHPLPSHRSTCPICLCDFESPLQPPHPQQQQQENVDPAEPEPLRLLPCQHVLHASCIDQWLTTVSGRCPICQRPVLKEEQEETERLQGEGQREGERAGGARIAIQRGGHPHQPQPAVEV